MVLPALLLLATPLVPMARAEPGAPAAAASSTPVAFETHEKWRPGERLATAGHNVNVRLAPGTAADIVARLPLGTAFVIDEADPNEFSDVDGRKGQWVRGRAVGPGAPAVQGWVWDGALTHAAYEADLDGDGELEVVTVGFNDKIEVVVRVREPAIDGPEAVTALNLGQAFDIDGPQRALHVRVLRVEDAAIPLVWVNWAAQEMCGSGDYSRYASYRSPGPGTPGTLNLALEHRGSGGDAPMWYQTAATWAPADRTVSVHSTSGEYNNEGSPEIEHDETISYHLEGGVYVATDRSKAPAEKP